MLKRNVLFVFILFLVFVFGVEQGQRAEPMMLPPSDKICSVVLMRNNEIMTYTDDQWIHDFVTAVLEAEPTAQQSVQDVPDAKNYLKIDIMCGDDINTCFLYQEKGNYYLEQPYQGIYKTDAAFVNLLHL